VTSEVAFDYKSLILMKRDRQELGKMLLPIISRVDDIQNNQSTFRISWENEWRLKLIRDHGGASSGDCKLERGASSMMPEVQSETNRYKPWRMLLVLN
jgi:hypothetical protein